MINAAFDKGPRRKEQAMGQIGIWQIIVIILFSALWIIPLWRIFPRAGLPPALSLLSVVPIVGIILLWVLAFKRWPADGG